MGGNVECKSFVGGAGTTFTVSVPLPVAKLEDLKQEAVEDKLSGRVLVVLREGPGLEFVRDLCEEWGMTTSVISFEENPHGHAGAIAASLRPKLLEAFEQQEEALLVIDCQVYLYIIADSPASLSGRRLILVGHLDDQAKLPPKSVAQFVLRPIKPSLFRSKLQAASSQPPAHLTVEASPQQQEKPQAKAEEAAPTAEDRMQILIVEVRCEG
eukprot:605782-Hanusia_phi.AAC.1